jgi:hypothetical protein
MAYRKSNVPTYNRCLQSAARVGDKEITKNLPMALANLLENIFGYSYVFLLVCYRFVKKKWHSFLVFTPAMRMNMIYIINFMKMAVEYDS